MAVRFFWQPTRCLLHLENKNTTSTTTKLLLSVPTCGWSPVMLTNLIQQTWNTDRRNSFSVSAWFVGGLGWFNPTLVLPNPLSFHWPPTGLVKNSQKYIADSLWFYHKSSTVFGDPMTWRYDWQGRKTASQSTANDGQILRLWQFLGICTRLPSTGGVDDFKFQNYYEETQYRFQLKALVSWSVRGLVGRSGWNKLLDYFQEEYISQRIFPQHLMEQFTEYSSESGKEKRNTRRTGHMSML